MKITEGKGDDFDKVDRLLNEIFAGFGGFEEFSRMMENPDLKTEFYGFDYAAGDS